MTRILAYSMLLVFCVAFPAAAEPADAPADVSPLLPGESLPAGVRVHDLNGAGIDLGERLAAGRHIVIFYRGGWCPYCNKHLSELADIEPELIGLGYEILAISPDRPQRLAEYADLLGETLQTTLLSDSSMAAADAFGLAFRVPDDLVEKYRGWNIDLEKDSGETHHLLPVPAAYVFVDGVIRFQYVNPDYKVRVPGELLLTAARIGVEHSETESNR